ncbi:MAG: hypothetical protein ACKODH_07135, partial [Limisphaerales bacterium]
MAHDQLRQGLHVFSGEAAGVEAEIVEGAAKEGSAGVTDRNLLSGRSALQKGAFHAAFKKWTAHLSDNKSKTKADMQKNKHALLNFPEGMAQLIQVLSHHVGHEAIRLNSAVEQLNYNP